MKMKVKLDPGAFVPTRAHSTDAGMDIYAPDDIILPGSVCYGVGRSPSSVNIGKVFIDTGVHVEIPEGYVGMLKSKSGLNANRGITSEGVIDAGYTGSIGVVLYNHTAGDFHIKRGQKISQLVILPIVIPELELVDSLDETERGTSGFGSTGSF